MNLESGKELSLEELKRLNQPEQVTSAQLLKRLDDAVYNQGVIHGSILDLEEQVSSLKTQLDTLTKLTIQQQAGKPKERRFSPPRIRLPRLRLSPALLLIPVILLVCWAMWYSWDTLWSMLRMMLPS